MESAGEGVGDRVKKLQQQRSKHMVLSGSRGEPDRPDGRRRSQTGSKTIAAVSRREAVPLLRAWSRTISQTHEDEKHSASQNLHPHDWNPLELLSRSVQMSCYRDRARSDVITQARRTIRGNDTRRLFTGRIRLRASRFVSGALEHRKAGILGKSGIRRGALAQQESRSPIGLYPPHEPALDTQTRANGGAAPIEWPLHADRISRCGNPSPAPQSRSA
jgi:hypothetical protein